MDWKADIDAAALRIHDHILRTPTARVNGFGLDRAIEMKFEQTQHTGSFKVRGAFNSMLATDAPVAGYVAASGGNHGAAVAHAARALGRRAHIFVPEMAGPAKIALIRSTGAELTVVPGDYSGALRAAQGYEARTGAAQIHAYDAPLTVAGQGTCLREWEEQGLEADTVLIAVGGGGLIGGALAWLQGRRKVVAVEPETAATLHSALAAGPDTQVEASGIAANALGARRIGRICHRLATQYATNSILVPDDAIADAQRLLWCERRQLVEPAGAAALAALTWGAYRPGPGEKVAVLVCGANPEPDPFAQAGQLPAAGQPTIGAATRDISRE
ncbi:MAG: threonine/serine dehydratase [Rhodobacteraceae bacterium]|nr:threonine/serine dehydratase [Paracoccaceae bacterium]